MGKFDNGVSYYTDGFAIIPVHFPEDEVKCKWCPFCRAESELGRYWCRLVNRQVYEPKMDGLPEFCPIQFPTEYKEDDDGEQYRYL